MKRMLPLSTVALVVAGALSGALAAGFPGLTRVQWHDDLQTAHRSAVSQDKPLLLVFGAEWCGYCKKLEQKTLGRRPMVDYVNQTFVPVHLDFDRDPQIAEILDVKSLPCTVILSPEADLLGRLEGYVEHDEYRQVLDRALEVQTRVRQAEARFATRRR